LVNKLNNRIKNVEGLQIFINDAQSLFNAIVQIPTLFSPTKRFESNIASSLLEFQNYTDQVQRAVKTGISEEAALNHILGLVRTREEIARSKDQISGWLKDNQSLNFSSQTERLNELNKISMNHSFKLYKELLNVSSTNS
jgi:hypothetical protein